MLVVNLFGTPQATVDGRPLQVDTTKAIALLAYLVVERTATRDTLANLFWAEAAEERARATLRRTLSALRTAVGSESIVADRVTVTLTGVVVSDHDSILTELDATGTHGHGVDEVCPDCIPHLRRAADLYRGPFLRGFSVRASPEFEDWSRSVAESMKGKIGDALHRLGTALAASGDYHGAITATRQWIELDPIHEPAHRSLMLLQAWAGDRSGAIESYRNCVRVLDQELGVPPLEETTELYEAILDEDLPPAPGLRRRLIATEPPPPLPLTLIDRDGEIAELRQAWGEALDGRGRVVVLSGEPWMGKTRLLEELVAETARQEVHILSARAFRTEHDLPFGVVTPMARTAHARLGTAQIEIPSWVREQFAKLLPELDHGSTETTPDEFGELRLLEAFHAVAVALAGHRPVLMAIDDVHWIDDPSARVLVYLARRISDLPVLMVLSARSGEALSPHASGLLTSADLQIPVEPLDIAKITPLAGGDAELAGRVRAETGGVPLLVSEALSGDEVQQGSGMARYVGARLSEVGDLARQVLAAAAVLRGMCDPTLLRETSGRTEEETVEAVDELLAAGVLREASDTAELTFALEAMELQAYESTSLARRRLLHRRAAQALANRPHARADVKLAAGVATHYQAAADREAAEWSMLAGDLSRSVYAVESARHFYEAALALGFAPAAEARLAIAELDMADGKYEEARRQLTLAGASDAGGVNGVVSHRLGEVERLLGRFDLAEAHFRDAIAAGASEPEVLADWALLASRTGRPRDALVLAERARNAVESSGEPAQHARVLNALAAVTDDPEIGLARAEEALGLAGSDDLLSMAVLNNMALLLARLDQPDRALGLLERAIEIAERTGHRHREAALRNHLADLLYRTGAEQEAQESLLRAVSLFADIDAGSFEPELWLLSRW